MSPSSALVTGCNRGIGLELVRQLLAMPSPPRHLFATYRNPATAEELLELATTSPSLHALQLEVTDTGAHAALVAKVQAIVGEEGLNLLINNAGMFERLDLESVTPEGMTQHFQTNCVAPLFLTRAFLPLLQLAAGHSATQGKSVDKAAVVQISSVFASIGAVAKTYAHINNAYAYRCSKAALNMATASLAADLAVAPVLVVAVHPGWVQTDMGGPQALISTKNSVTAMLETFTKLSEEDHGAFRTFHNKPIQW